MDKYYLRFPSVLKDAINTYGMRFPEGTLWKYEPQPAFRGIVRKNEEDLTVKDSDFLSYAELGKVPRGKSKNDIGLYSCSCYNNRKQLEVGLKLPRPNRRIVSGDIKYNKGCININTSTGHIDWWIYENAKTLLRLALETNNRNDQDVLERMVYRILSDERFRKAVTA